MIDTEKEREHQLNEKMKQTRLEDFLSDLSEWELQNEKLGINTAAKYRTKYCGDCSHHLPSDPDYNSGSYTSCGITHQSVYFGMVCNCKKWAYRIDIHGMGK